MAQMLQALWQFFHLFAYLTELQVKSISIDRIQAVACLPQEETPPFDEFEPEDGCISFENVSVRYTLDAPLALSRISLTVASGQRVGICGTSGSGKHNHVSAGRLLTSSTGKSTLLAALFRSVNIESGCITSTRCSTSCLQCRSLILVAVGSGDVKTSPRDRT